MNSKVLSFAAGLAMFTAAAASAVPSTVTQNSTQTVTQSGTSFTFNTFNSSLGTLTAVSLLVQSSDISGNFTVARTGGASNVTINGITTNLFLTGAVGSGLGDDGGYSVGISPARDPSGSFILNSSNSFTRVVGINGTQSLVSGTPTTVLFDGGLNLNYYIGDGTSTFAYNGLLDIVLNQSGSAGSTASVTSSNALAPTQLTLQYSYTPGIAPIPEPGQVAASLLLLGGIGAYVFIKRRKKSAPATA